MMRRPPIRICRSYENCCMHYSSALPLTDVLLSACGCIVAMNGAS